MMPFALHTSHEPTAGISYCTDSSFKQMNVERPIELK
jgi:hypothetical protein